MFVRSAQKFTLERHLPFTDYSQNLANLLLNIYIYILYIT